MALLTGVSEQTLKYESVRQKLLAKVKLELKAAIKKSTMSDIGLKLNMHQDRLDEFIIGNADNHIDINYLFRILIHLGIDFKIFVNGADIDFS